MRRLHRLGPVVLTLALAVPVTGDAATLATCTSTAGASCTTSFTLIESPYTPVVVTIAPDGPIGGGTAQITGPDGACYGDYAGAPCEKTVYATVANGVLVPNPFSSPNRFEFGPGAFTVTFTGNVTSSGGAGSATVIVETAGHAALAACRYNQAAVSATAACPAQSFTAASPTPATLRAFMYWGTVTASITPGGRCVPANCSIEATFVDGVLVAGDDSLDVTIDGGAGAVYLHVQARGLVSEFRGEVSPR